jgi:2-iminobutanoate/2-iminopropanoate deaminase
MPARKKAAPARTAKKAPAKTKKSGNVPVNPKGWPKPIGPFNQAIRNGNLLFVSGQGPLDPKVGKFVLGPIEQQTQLTLTNIKTILEAAGGTLANVTMVSVHLANLSDFVAMNGVYQKFFTGVAPARVTVGSSLLEGIGIEVSCEAVLD